MWHIKVLLQVKRPLMLFKTHPYDVLLSISYHRRKFHQHSMGIVRNDGGCHSVTLLLLLRVHHLLRLLHGRAPSWNTPHTHYQVTSVLAFSRLCSCISKIFWQCIAYMTIFMLPFARKWRFSVPCSANPRPHLKHLKGFSPVWWRMWRTRAPFSRNAREQCEHTYGLSSPCVRWCTWSAF